MHQIPSNFRTNNTTSSRKRRGSSSSSSCINHERSEERIGNRNRVRSGKKGREGGKVGVRRKVRNVDRCLPACCSGKYCSICLHCSSFIFYAFPFDTLSQIPKPF
ncbi:hypothetical protein O6H91_Y028200 [Diphasiastrum complanatum]|nr:hypothetical protein O6H91_Y028200 [Diphasiastrum complanatum]